MKSNSRGLLLFSRENGKMGIGFRVSPWGGLAP